MLSELIRTVKVRLDQIEEDEQDVRNNENETDESDIEDEDEGTEDGETDDGENADISEDDDELWIQMQMILEFVFLISFF